MKKLISGGAAVLLTAGAMALGMVAPASATAIGEGTYEDPIIVTDPSEVPEGAVEDEVSTYNTADLLCDTTRSWTLTTPGTPEVPAVPAVTHDESTYSRDVPAVIGVEKRTYQRVVHHEAVPRVLQTEMQYKRKVVTQEKQPAIPGTSEYWLLDEKWYDEGVNPDGFDNGNQWSICNQRINKENGTPYTKSYQWHQLIPGTPTIPSQKEQWEWQFSEVIFDDATPPSDSYPLPEGGLYAPNGWAKIVNKTNIISPAVPAWDETFYFNGQPGGSTNPADAVAVSYAPSGDWETYGDPIWDPAPVDAYTIWYTGEGDGSTNAEDAAWVDYTPTGEWALTDTRTIVDEEAVPAVPAGPDSVVYYAYSDGLECAVIPPIEEPKAEEPKDDKPVKLAAAMVTASEEDQLAVTGGAVDPWILALGALAIAGGIGAITLPLAYRKRG